jgi:hypothetical protein
MQQMQSHQAIRKCTQLKAREDMQQAMYLRGGFHKQHSQNCDLILLVRP